MTGFNISDKGKLTPDQRFNVMERLTDFHRENDIRRSVGERPLSKNSLITELRESGLSYRRQDILDDIRRTGVSYKARDVEAMGRAQSFYDNVLEPLRKENNLTEKEAWRLWNRIKEQDWENLLEAERYAEVWDVYKG